MSTFVRPNVVYLVTPLAIKLFASHHIQSVTEKLPPGQQEVAGMRGKGRSLTVQWKVFSHFLYSQRCVYLSNNPVSQSKTTRAVTTASTLQKPRLPFSLSLSQSLSICFTLSGWQLVFVSSLRQGFKQRAQVKQHHRCLVMVQVNSHMLSFTLLVLLYQIVPVWICKRKPEVCFLF